MESRISGPTHVCVSPPRQVKKLPAHQIPTLPHSPLCLTPTHKAPSSSLDEKAKGDSWTQTSQWVKGTLCIAYDATGSEKSQCLMCWQLPYSHLVQVRLHSFVSFLFHYCINLLSSSLYNRQSYKTAKTFYSPLIISHSCSVSAR